MPSAKDRREAVEFLRTHWCAYKGRDKTIADCHRCTMASRSLFGNDDALCDLGSSGPGTWDRLADLIEGKN